MRENPHVRDSIRWHNKRLDELTRRDGTSCHYCGRVTVVTDSVRADQRVIDHVKPWSKGGRNTLHNLVISCFACNASKSDKMPLRSNGSRVRRIFAELLQHAQQRAPGFHCSLKIGRDSEFPKARDFAYCVQRKEGAPIAIAVAPKLESQSTDRITAILMHELAHFLAFAVGEHDHSEREADEIARAVFGRTIRYDAEDVQSLAHGVSPRPARLG